MKPGNICFMNDWRTIITDRMGPWSRQNVVLTWEGVCGEEYISLTPDEIEVLFKNGFTKNVFRNENGKLYMGWKYLDVRIYDRAIVCGILAPSTQSKMRTEIIDYAKKMGYVTDEMTPVKMASGTKSLIFNPDGTYSIFFEWNDNVVEKFERKFLDSFTKNFFNTAKNVEILSNGVLINNLSENEAFSRANIDTFREYDIQLIYLDPEIDKKLLLRAVMQRAFIHLPCNTLREGMFEKAGNSMIPEDRQTSITFNSFGNIQMNCGKLHHSNIDGVEHYSYCIAVPYSEAIRELMIDTEKVLKARYGKKVYVGFSGFGEYLDISCNGEDITSDVEQSFISLDYAMKLLQDERNFNGHQLFRSIISMLESDSSRKFRNEYFSYLEMLKHVLPEKW